MANYIIVGGDSQEYGPVTEEDIRLWISEGRLDAQSRAKIEGDQNFRPLSLFPEFANALSGGASTPGIIAPPGRTARVEDASRQEDVLSRKPELKLGECLAAGWSFLGDNLGFVAGAVLLAWLATQPFVFLSLEIPIIGPMMLCGFNGVIMGGFYLACLRRLRGEAVSPTAALCGFSVAFAQLMLAGLVSMMLIEASCCLFILPCIYLAVAWAFVLPLAADQRLFFWTAMELSRKVVTRGWFKVFALLIITYLPLVLFQIYSTVQTATLLLHSGLKPDQGFLQLVQQFSQLLQNQTFVDASLKMTCKLTIIGQLATLVNLFYAAGVITRAYENLFGVKKP